MGKLLHSRGLNALTLFVILTLMLMPLVYSEGQEDSYLKIKEKNPSHDQGGFGEISLIEIFYVTTESEDLPLLLTITHDPTTNVTAGTDSAVIEWTTDNPANGIIDYGTAADNLDKARSESVADATTHSVTISPLQEQTRYYYRINSTDLSGGNALSNGEFTTKDSVAPAKVQGLVSTFVGFNSVSISWDPNPEQDLDYYMILRSGTNIANTTNPYYDDNTAYPETQYTYVIKAVDLSGNQGMASDSVVITTESAPYDVIPPQISQLSTDVTDRTAMITWQTDEPSSSLIYYGTTQSLGEARPGTGDVTTHRILLINLNNGAEYHFKAESCDDRNNCVNSSIGTFTTAVEDVFPPPIEVSVPTISISSPITLNITTEPLTRITINNGLMTYSATANIEGLARVFNVQLQRGPNTLTIEATDTSGNTRTLVLNTQLDDLAPEIFVNQTPKMLGSADYEIQGVVNKNVSIQVIVIEGGQDQVPPDRVTGLQLEEAGPNYLDISWNETRAIDLDEYIIYRNGTSINGVTRNRFRDSALDTDTFYEYKIAAVDKSCNFGSLSVPLKEKTLTGGIDLDITPRPYNHTCLSRETIAAEGVFDRGPFSLNITNLKDGNNTIFIKATDIANRTDTARFDVYIDTQAPEIRDVTPRDGTNIYEVHANSVDIRGRTEPHAKVKLFAVLSTFDYDEFDGDTEVITIREIDEEDKADADGEFEFENINIVKYVRGGIVEVDPGYENTAGMYDDITRTDEVRLMIKATDLAGKEANITITYRIGICFSGELIYNIIPLPQYQAPGFLSPERLAEGTEEISFVFNVSKLGGDVEPDEPADLAGERGRRTGRSTARPSVRMTIRSACDRYVKELEHYNWSCKALRSCRATPNPEGTMFYVTCPLSRIGELEQFQGDDWKDLFRTLNNEMRFPLKVQLTYTTKDENDRTVTGKQSSCEEVTFVLDNSRIDPRDVLPDWLLEDGVEFLNKTIETISKINEMIQEVLRITAMACIGGFFAKTATTMGRIWTCKSEQIGKKTWEAVSGVATAGMEEQIDECKICMEIYSANFTGSLNTSAQNLIKKLIPGGELLLDDQETIPDQCMPLCFPRCAAAWDSEASTYTMYRWACDRVFCHTSPSRWTEDQPDEQLFPNITRSGPKGCGINTNVQGRTLFASKCKVLAKERGIPETVRKFNEDALCIKLKEKEGGNSIYLIDKEASEGNIYKMQIPPGGFGQSEKTRYVIKVSENYYMTARDETCSEQCGDKEKSGKKGDTIKLTPGFHEKGDTATTSGKAEQPKFGVCTTTTQCYEIGKQSPTGKTPIQSATLKKVGIENGTIKSTYTAGYTEGCFYGDDLSLAEMSDKPDTQYQCCCINSEPGEGKDYYQPEDPYIEKRDGERPTGIDKIEEIFNPDNRPGAGNYSEMKWSYRYSKIGFADKEYNPYRYIKERDEPACFGQNSWFHDWSVPEGGQGKLLMLDPFKQHVAAFQCLCISAIYNRLVLVQNILSYMRNCLVEVRETGSADSGTCKELFTQYVCGFLWDIISYIKDGCSPLYSGAYPGGQDEALGGTLQTGLQSFFGSLEESTQDFNQEYGNAEITNLLGVGEGAIARKLCLAAFGFDWELDLDRVVEAAYSTPYQTMVNSVIRTREYLGFNPQTKNSKYEYRATWMINPGCNIDYYDVSLACVTQNEAARYNGINCAKVEDPSGHNCDCFELDAPKESIVWRGRRLTQNELVDEDYHDVITAPFRYDHLKFALRADRRLDRYNPDMEEKCFPDGHEDGIFYYPIRDRTPQDIIDCQLDVLSGQFICGAGGTLMWDKRGEAYLRDVMINGNPGRENVFVEELNDSIDFSATIYNAGEPKCLFIEVEKANSQVLPFHREIDYNGSFEFEFPLMDASDVRLTGGGGVKRGAIINCSLGSDIEPDNPDMSKRDYCHNIVKRARKYPEFMIVDPNPDKNVEFNITFVLKDYDFDSMKLDGSGNYNLNQEIEKDGARIKLEVDNLLRYEEYTKLFDEVEEFTIVYTVNKPSELRQTEEWEIVYGLYYLPEGGSCYDDDLYVNDPVFYQNDIQEGIARITVGTEQESARRGNRCSGEGYIPVSPLVCDCDGRDGTGSGLGVDCGRDESTGKVYKYCYNPEDADEYSKCFENPRCQQDGTRLTRTDVCDCDWDGDANGTEDCNVSASRFYCYTESAMAPAYCHRDPEKCVGDGNEELSTYCDCDGDKDLDSSDCNAQKKYCYKSDDETGKTCKPTPASESPPIGPVTA